MSRLASKNCILMMWLSGVGKSTIGALLARKIDGTFLDSDDFHPDTNIEKMKSGIPLNDSNRFMGN